MSRAEQAPAQGLGPLTRAEAEEFVRQFSEGWDQPKPEGFIEYFRPLLAPDLRLVQPMAPDAHGPEGFAALFRGLHSLFPDYHVAVEDWAHEGDVLYLRLTHTATIGRRQRSWEGIDRITLRDGMLVERIAYFDPAPMMGASARSPSVWPRLARWGLTQRRS